MTVRSRDRGTRLWVNVPLDCVGQAAGSKSTSAAIRHAMPAFPNPADAARSTCEHALARLRGGDGEAMAGWISEHLFGHVLPFWTRHAIDPRGGILTCIDDDGTVRSGDKWLWSQWRAVWVFSRLHRSLDRNGPWLKRAQDIAAFCVRHAWDAQQRHWALLVAQDGSVLRGHESTYADAFAVQGLVELYRASGDDALLRLARETADAVLVELAGPRDAVPHFPYPIPPGGKPHAIAMIWSLVLAELGAAAGDERYLQAAAAFSDEIFRDFHRANRGMCLEFVRADGAELPPPIGTVVVPGHAIESMWFQIHVGRILKGRDHLVPLACAVIGRHLELGWDAEGGGGLVLAVDADGRGEVGWNFADSKLWWPLTEALYAALLAWRIEGGTRYLEWYERLWRLALERYVDGQHGEWRQKLTRQFTPLDATVALPVKDPYHLPRSLVLQLELLRGSGAVLQ